MKMKIVIGNDHSGVDFKNQLVGHLLSKGIEVINVGTDSVDSVDYPDIAKEVSKKVLEKEANFGMLICGTGIGISIAANRISGIRAALVTNELCARLSRQHNDANILVLGARVTGIELAKSCVDAFLSAEFEGGRHSNRISKIECGCTNGVIE
ncbi:ribose 5-phosphate isomerase B [Streptobacillus felis]|uniref:Ribose 5-phosphate isomerase B n=2 Tax=Streptobacillus felis TaxID=1384509 RepID=A0A7Z0PH13_9FUSO|nr:ribose 5-phosphate isomerase B [Streptobacillus felis]